VNAIESFFSVRFPNMRVRFSQREEINQRFQQSTPCIGMFFPQVAGKDSRDAFKTAAEKAHNLALLMSIDSGAAPEFLLAAAFSETGTVDLYFRPPTYKGNLLSPFAPNDYFLNKNFEKLDTDPETQLYFALYRDAVAESNFDLSYFRYCVLIESIALGRGLHKGERGIKDLFHDHEQKNNVILGTNVSGISYSADRCIEVWVARRNITAHFVAFDPKNPRQQQQRKSFEIAASSLIEIKKAETDFYLDHLKHITRLFLQSLLSK